MSAEPLPLNMPEPERGLSVEAAIVLATKFCERQCAAGPHRKLADFEILEAIAHQAGHVIVRCRHRCLLADWTSHEMAFDGVTGELLAIRKL